MNFLEKLKDDLNDTRNRHGMHEKCVVNSRALRELIHHFESLDSVARLKHSEDAAISLEHKLFLNLDAIFKNNGGHADTIMMVVLDCLKPLILEQKKVREIEGQFGIY